MIKIIKNFFISSFSIFFIVGFTFAQSEKLYIPGEVPLGMAYDGRVLWIADVKEKKITGYDFDLKKVTYQNNIKTPGIRDIAFWKVYLLSPYKKYLFVIDPITGNIVEKIHIPEMTDPSSIAVHKNLVYIYDRNKNYFYRFDMISRKLIGQFSLPFLHNQNEEKVYLRGATWFKDAIWVADKSNHLYKINPENGEKLTFLPVPENTYSVEFIDGQLYFASEDYVETLEFTETDYYIASKKENFKLHMDYHIHAPWGKNQIQTEKSLKICFNIFRMNPQSQYDQYKHEAKPINIRRYNGGELRVCSEHKNGKIHMEDHLSANFQLRSTVFMLNNDTIEHFFQSYTLPPYPRYYTNTKNYNKETIQKIKKLKEKWKNQYDGMHPYKKIAFLENNGIVSLDEKILFFRLFQVPAREAVFYKMKDKQMASFLQVYFYPIGWLTITDLYNPEFPKEFPIPEHYLELYYPETLTIRPDVITYDEDGKKRIKILTKEDRQKILQFQNLQRQASE